jgi:hypothetical protein
MASIRRSSVCLCVSPGRLGLCKLGRTCLAQKSVECVTWLPRRARRLAPVGDALVGAGEWSSSSVTPIERPMIICPNCGVYLAFPLSECRGGRCSFCGYGPGGYDEREKNERKESPWIGHLSRNSPRALSIDPPFDFFCFSFPLASLRHARPSLAGALPRSSRWSI